MYRLHVSQCDVHVCGISGVGYYHISNAMQYSNTALEVIALVMYGPKMFFYMVPLVLMTLRIS